MSFTEATDVSSFDGWPLSGCTTEDGGLTFYNCTWNPRNRRVKGVRARIFEHRLHYSLIYPASPAPSSRLGYPALRSCVLRPRSLVPPRMARVQASFRSCKSASHATTTNRVFGTAFPPNSLSKYSFMEWWPRCHLVYAL
jgi:hypothetical protein